MDQTVTANIHERHKRERKDLLNQIQDMKRSVPKGDKKCKKQVTVEIAQLEAELDERHAKELEVNGCDSKGGSTDIVEIFSSLDVSGEDVNGQPQVKISKAQKRREKKETEERERRKRLEEGEKEASSHVRNVEAGLFEKLLQGTSLRIVEVNPDGNCLYNSVVLQIPDVTLAELRCKVSEHMLEHVNDFLPFTLNNDTGDIFSREEYEEYCSNIKNTHAWGGSLELQAISKLFKQPIEVYQASSPVLRIGEEYKETPIRLSYHHHQYGLGEHYNAVLPQV